MAITHNAVVDVPDDGTSPVGSDEWNAEHVIEAGTITDTEVAATNKDGDPATASMRTLGTGATAACAGDDARLTNARTPSAHAGTHITAGGDTIAAAAAAGNAGLMTGADKTKLDAINLSFPYAIVVGSGVTSAPSGATTSVSFGTTPALLTDPSGFYSASHPTRLTVPSGMGGLYQVVGSLAIAANAAGAREASFFHNATTNEAYIALPAPPATEPSLLNLSELLVLAAGDYLELRGWQNSGVALSLSSMPPSAPRLS